jgi:hypothetical protein
VAAFHAIPSGAARVHAAEVTLVPTMQRFIAGVSELDRRQCFNVARGSPKF